MPTQGITKWQRGGHLLAWGRMEYRRQITCILKGKSITLIIQFFIIFRHRNVEGLCAFTIFHDK